MSVANYFKVIGTVYGDAEKIPIKKENARNKYYTHFTVVVHGDSKEWKKNYIPFIACGTLAEKAFHLCRNGNKVAVKGEVLTNEFFDRNSGEFKVEIVFLAKEVMLIVKTRKISVLPARYSKALEMASIEPYKPPTRKDKNNGKQSK